MQAHGLESLRVLFWESKERTERTLWGWDSFYYSPKPLPKPTAPRGAYKQPKYLYKCWTKRNRVRGLQAALTSTGSGLLVHSPLALFTVFKGRKDQQPSSHPVCKTLRTPARASSWRPPQTGNVSRRDFPAPYFFLFSCFPFFHLSFLPFLSPFPLLSSSFFIGISHVSKDALETPETLASQGLGYRHELPHQVISYSNSLNSFLSSQLNVQILGVWWCKVGWLPLSFAPWWSGICFLGSNSFAQFPSPC